jgi:hypothetical protein
MSDFNLTRYQLACELAISGERGYGCRRRDGAPPVRGKGSTSPSCTTSSTFFRARAADDGLLVKGGWYVYSSQLGVPA